MQNFILLVFISTFLLGLSHGFQWGLAEEELKRFGEDQTMLKQVRNARNVEMEAAKEGSGEVTSGPAMRRQREVNEDGLSSVEDVEGNGQALIEMENDQMNIMTLTTEKTTTEKPKTTEEITTEMTTQKTTTEGPKTTEEITTEKPNTTKKITTEMTTEETTTRKTINASITTTPYVPTTRIIHLGKGVDAITMIFYENGTITDDEGNPIIFDNVEQCTKYVNTNKWLNNSIDKNPEGCNDDLSKMEQSYEKWWALGLAFIISTCVSCCCCCFCIALDCYLQYTDNHIRLFSR